jgi:hypothetical protein
MCQSQPSYNLALLPIIVIAYNNDEQYIESKRKKERHRFNMVWQFAYVHKDAAIILLIIQGYINNIYIYIYIYIGKKPKPYLYERSTELYRGLYRNPKIPRTVLPLHPHNLIILPRKLNYAHRPIDSRSMNITIATFTTFPST